MHIHAHIDSGKNSNVFSLYIQQSQSDGSQICNARTIVYVFGFSYLFPTYLPNLSYAICY